MSAPVKEIHDVINSARQIPGESAALTETRRGMRGRQVSLGPARSNASDHGTAEKITHPIHEVTEPLPLRARCRECAPVVHATPTVMTAFRLAEFRKSTSRKAHLRSIPSRGDGVRTPAFCSPARGILYKVKVED